MFLSPYWIPSILESWFVFVISISLTFVFSLASLTHLFILSFFFCLISFSSYFFVSSLNSLNTLMMFRIVSEVHLGNVIATLSPILVEFGKKILSWSFILLYSCFDVWVSRFPLLFLSVLSLNRLWRNSRHGDRLGLEIGFGLGWMKSGGQHRLGWYTKCAYCSKSGVWEYIWLERLRVRTSISYYRDWSMTIGYEKHTPSKEMEPDAPLPRVGTR